MALWLPLDIAETYPYYAPLGAVVGSSSTVRSSASASVRAVLGIVAGAVLALAADALFRPGVLVVAVVVGLATLLAGWRALGDQRAWVLTVALFVLVVGAADPVQYALAYTALTLLGGAVAVAVNALLPEIPLAGSDRALRALAATLGAQLDDLAEALQRDDPPPVAEWRRRVRDVRPLREALVDSGTAVGESLQANVRRRRNTDRVRRWRTSGVQLANLASRVEELTELLVEVQSRSDRDVALGSDLRVPTARVLTALAAAVREAPGPDGVSPARADDLRARVRGLSAAEAGAAHPTERERQTAGAVVTLTRRCLGALETGSAAADPEAVLPTPWARPEDPGAPPGAGRWRALRDRVAGWR